MSHHKTQHGRKPPKCPGTIYTVKPGDTMYFIAKRFCVDLDRLIAANPQIKDPNMIFPGDQICIPKKVKEQVPQVESVHFYDKHWNELPEWKDRIKLAPKTIVKVKFSRPVKEAFLLFAPRREDTELIQAKEVDEEKHVKFFWEVPKGIKGEVFVIGCSESVCGRSEDISVISKRKYDKHGEFEHMDIEE